LDDNEKSFGVFKTYSKLCLALYKYPTVLKGYSDANWITGSNKVKSTSGYVFTLGGGAISWKFSKKTCIASSTMISELGALDKAGEQVERLRNFLIDILIGPNHWHQYAYTLIVKMQ